MGENWNYLSEKRCRWKWQQEKPINSKISRHTRTNAVGLFESKHHCHPLSRVSIRSSVIPYQAFRSRLNVSDPQNGGLTGTIQDSSLEKWEVSRWISEKRRRNNFGSGPSLFTIPSLEPILRCCLATASSVVRGWSGNTVKCQRGLFLAVAGSITNTTACLIWLSLNRAAVQETISD